MRTTLEDTFQKRKQEELYMALQKAQKIYANPELRMRQIISLTAPTGAGKTLIITQLIEDVMRGRSPFPRQEDAIFLWLSDMPDLNEQSKQKLMNELVPNISADKFKPIEAETFNQRLLEDGHIYFINTQKLGDKKNLVEKGGGDRRQYTFWDTMRHTIEEKGERLFLIIDEAHRGTDDNPKEFSKANSIMQKFLKGSQDDNMPPMPIVIGMSATAERFQELVKNISGVGTQVVEITPDDVRPSGLLKDHIELDYSGEQRHGGEMTIMRLAVEEWLDKCNHWQQYHELHGEKLVKPIMTIQVNDKGEHSSTKTDIDECLRVIEEVTGEKLEVGEVVNSFTEKKDIEANGMRVVYMEPQRINDDERVKIVFFKQNLSTGWDCPRAETMMSFRNAKDYTYISQLLGRLVRTPLHHRIETGDDSLNEVRLFLPHFDSETAKQIVDYLNAKGLPGANARKAGKKDVQTLHVDEELRDVFEWINGLALTSDIVTNNKIRNYVVSLFRLAELIKNETPDKNVKRDITNMTTRMITNYISELKENGKYEDKIKELDTFIVNGGRLAYLRDTQIKEETMFSVSRLSYDLQKEYEVVDKQLAEEIATPYVQTCVDSDELQEYQKHVIIYAGDKKDELEKFAKRTFNNLKDNYRDILTNKNQTIRKKFNDIVRETDNSDSTWRLYEPFYLPKGDVEKEGHLYVCEEGTPSFDLDGWEQIVIDDEKSKQGFKCWIRNPKSRPESLCLRRREGSLEIPFYPDFIVVSEINGELSLSILEPHDPSREDNLSKALAMIEYGKKEKKVKRLELIRIVDEKHIWRLDFKNSNVIEDMKAVDSNLKLTNLFKEYNER